MELSQDYYLKYDNHGFFVYFKMKFIHSLKSYINWKLKLTCDIILICRIEKNIVSQRLL